jgi:hypothetical protein
MTDLLAAVLAAHGGLDRWREFSTMEATIVSGGMLWQIKGQPQDPVPRRMTVALHREWASVQPFGAADQKTDFTPERIAIEKLDGRVVAERTDPRASFAGHELTTPWDPLQRAYFNGYALWTYLTTPFFMTLPGFTVTEIDPVEENGERWLDCRRIFRTRSPATVDCRSSTSTATSCCAATITAWTSPAGSPRSNTSTTWSRLTESSFRPSAGRTAATPTANSSQTNSWCQSTSATSS